MHRRVTKSEEKKTWNGNWRAKGTGKRKPRTLPDFYETRAGRAIELISILAIPRNFANSQGHKHGLLFVQGFQAWKFISSGYLSTNFPRIINRKSHVIGMYIDTQCVVDCVDSFEFLLKPDEITGSGYLLRKKKCRRELTRKHLERFSTNVSICIFRNGYFCFMEISRSIRWEWTLFGFRFDSKF